MSDTTDKALPPEGVVVLAWWVGKIHPAYLRNGWWYRMGKGCSITTIEPACGWIALSDARNAARYREALEQLAQWDWRTCEERDPANGPCHCSDCRTVALARAALENRP